MGRAQRVTLGKPKIDLAELGAFLVDSRQIMQQVEERYLGLTSLLDGANAPEDGIRRAAAAFERALAQSMQLDGPSVERLAYQLHNRTIGTTTRSTLAPHLLKTAFNALDRVCRDNASLIEMGTRAAQSFIRAGAPFAIHVSR
jgi:hypothetical protein